MDFLGINAMIFFVNFPKERPSDENEIAFVEEVMPSLLNAHGEGKHRVIIEREPCNWLRTLDIGRACKGTLDKIKEEYTQFGGMVDDSLVYVHIKFDDSELVFDESGDKQDIYRIGYKKLEQYNFLEIPHVGIENLVNDGFVYKRIFDVIVEKQFAKIDGYKNKFFHGGGSSLALVCETEIIDKCIVLCIVDSDRTCRGAKLGDTAKICKKVFDKASSKNSSISHMLITHGKALENYLPLCVMNELPGIQDKPLLTFANDPSIKDKFIFWQFLDLKEGICGKKIIKCVNSKRFYKQQIPECLDLSTLKVGGLGKDIIKSFRKNEAAIEKFEDYIATKEWQDSFLKDFERILWYLAAPKRSRT